jgi:predicted ATP-binding protein involved in virulence
MNVILDEIELYFHPDYQRQFISFLIDSIKELKIGGRKGVNSINILLATHSPFILSDIPSQNVLRLKDGKPYEEPQKGTFGANVHDLLHDSFFMEDGFMGKFAEEKINEVIKRINYEKQTLEIDRLYKLISSTETAISDKESLTKEKRKLEARRSDLYLDKPELSIDSCISLVEMIGEPAIQNKLCSMISTIKSQNENIAYLNEIQEIKKKYGKL